MKWSTNYSISPWIMWGMGKFIYCNWWFWLLKQPHLIYSKTFSIRHCCLSYLKPLICAGFSALGLWTKWPCFQSARRGVMASSRATPAQEWGPELRMVINIYRESTRNFTYKSAPEGGVGGETTHELKLGAKSLDFSLPQRGCGVSDR